MDTKVQLNMYKIPCYEFHSYITRFNVFIEYQTYKYVTRVSEMLHFYKAHVKTTALYLTSPNFFIAVNYRSHTSHIGMTIMQWK